MADMARRIGLRTTTLTDRFPPPGGRYTATAQALHWIVAALFVAQVVIAWTLVVRPDNDPGFGFWITLHKSIGMTILALVAIRLAWRASHPAPPLPPRMPLWEKLLARANHWVLYAILLVMPISGYLSSAAAGHTIHYFWLFDLPNLPQSRELAHNAIVVHAIGQWFIYAAVALHLSGTAWNLVVRRDGSLNRMLPEQSEA